MHFSVVNHHGFSSASWAPIEQRVPCTRHRGAVLSGCGYSSCPVPSKLASSSAANRLSIHKGVQCCQAAGAHHGFFQQAGLGSSSYHPGCDHSCSALQVPAQSAPWGVAFKVVCGLAVSLFGCIKSPPQLQWVNMPRCTIGVSSCGRPRVTTKYLEQPLIHPQAEWAPSKCSLWGCERAAARHLI